MIYSSSYAHQVVLRIDVTGESSDVASEVGNPLGCRYCFREHVSGFLAISRARPRSLAEISESSPRN
jgi:hypothetical protein